MPTVLTGAGRDRPLHPWPPMLPSAPADPLALFHDLFERAESAEEGDPTVAALATVGPTGAPSVRVVLIKGVDARGLTFFTNYGSRKARELEADRRCALCSYWPSIGVQVRLEGDAERVTAEESDAYFATRPRESQLAAWASRQSQPLASRDELLRRYADAEERLPQRVPRPPFWGGYRLVPIRAEFWQADDRRLHHRVLYVRAAEGWRPQLLYP